jgi:hypothetical protein
MRQGLAFLCFAAAAAIACGGPDDSTVTTGASSSAVAPDQDAGEGGLDLTAAAPSDDDAAPFAACSTDKECVAVPKVGCCHLGWKAAVNANEVVSYHASFHCKVSQPICIQVLIFDDRVARCASGRCVLAEGN